MYMSHLPLISSLATILSISMAILYKKNKLQEIKEDFGNVRFLIPLAGTILFSYAVLNQKGETKDIEKMQTATKRALVALIVAYFARIDLVIAPFWLVWVFSYWTKESGGWI